MKNQAARYKVGLFISRFLSFDEGNVICAGRMLMNAIPISHVKDNKSSHCAESSPVG